MELELKHLAAYLPHNLSLRYKKRTEISVVALGFYEPINTRVIYFKTDFYDWQPMHPFLPILKPISQLTLSELENEAQFPKSIAFYALQSAKKNDLSQTPYFVVEYLLSKHYDIFDLISKGLAVEK